MVGIGATITAHSGCAPVAAWHQKLKLCLGRCDIGAISSGQDLLTLPRHVLSLRTK
jgi:hypothetical protein